MIASLTGKVQAKTADSLVLDVLGIGFEVSVPSLVANEAEIGEIVFFAHPHACPPRPDGALRL